MSVPARARMALAVGIALTPCLFAADPPAPPPGATAPAAPAAAPTADDIARAVRQLGDNRFSVREKASKTLWQAGAAAELPLREALRHPDPEVVRRARTLLDKFDWGIFPDTPAEVVGLIERYRDGDEEVKRQAVRDLVKAGRPGYLALARLGRRAASPEARRLIAEAMTEAAQRAVPTMLRERDYATAGALLEACLVGESEDALANYAAFALLRGQLTEAITRWEAEKTPRSAEVLTALYRANGDAAAARRWATTSGNAALLDGLLREQADWKELARRPAPPEQRPALRLSAKAAYHRLAGDLAGADAALNELRPLSAAGDAWVVARGLLLNGRVADAMTLLQGLSGHQKELFDLLTAQLRYKEAFAIADRPTTDEEDAAALPIKQARLHYLLGDKDRAGQLFAKIGDRLQAPGDGEMAVELVQTQYRLGLRDAAREQAARFLEVLGRTTVEARRDPARRLLDAAFPKQGDAAQVWWAFLRQKFPQENVAATMRRLRGLLDPAAGAAGPAEFAEALLAAQPAGEDDAAARAHDALATAYETAGHPDAVRRELTLAAEKTKDAATALTRWLRLGDFLAGRQEHAAAADAYDRAARGDPAQPLPLMLAGRAREQAGRAAEGRGQIEQAHWLPLGDVKQRGVLASELAKRGHDELARRERDVALRLGWSRNVSWAAGNLLSGLARDAVARKDFAAAAAAYDQLVVGVIVEDLNFMESSGFLVVPALAHAQRARAALAAGDLVNVRASAERCLSLTPGNLDLAILLVPELQRRGRQADADALYARAADPHDKLCREFPQSPFAHNSMAWLAACCRRDLDAALAHAQKATELAPKTASYLDTLAEVHFQRGDQAKAIETMKQCLALEPKNPYLARQLKRFEAGDRDAPPPQEHDDE